ncbi:KR domain-containing protein, partial [Streptomyces albus]|uniref:KR domain-containing protein n=1 Tax=Streptomyces albus TaxID=1888 RepID=UPI003133B75F
MEVVACDVGVRREVEDLFERFEVSAVVHAAGVLDDGVVGGLTVDRLGGVWEAEAGAAWHLHHALGDRELDAFVVFSSAAGVWGLGRVVALEEPDRWGGLVDVPVEPVGGSV